MDDQRKTHISKLILTVEAGRMHRDGHPLCLSQNGVWLTDAVAYLRFPDEATAD